MNTSAEVVSSPQRSRALGLIGWIPKVEVRSGRGMVYVPAGMSSGPSSQRSRALCLTLGAAVFIGATLFAAEGQPMDAGSRGKQSGAVRSEAGRLVSGDPVRIDDVVAGVPPSAILAITPVNPPTGMLSYPPGTTIAGNTMSSPNGGFRAWFNVQLSNWDPNGNNIPPLLGYQIKLDSTGYSSGTGVPLAPAIVPCTVNAQCVAAFGESWAKCESGICKAGYNTGSGADRPLDNWCTPAGCNANVSTVTPDYKYFGIYNNVVRFDGHIVYYGGTLVLDIPAGARGTYCIQLNTSETFLIDNSGPPIEIPTFIESGFCVEIGSVVVPCCFPEGYCAHVSESECPPGSILGHCTDGERCIPPADDCLTTPCGNTRVDFCNTPIPADFFAPSSLPFDGIIILGGNGLPDTTIHRSNAMLLDGPPETIPIELIQMNLTSCSPITVVINHLPTLWDVSVDLAPSTVPPGSMTVTKTHANGGTFSAQFNVLPRFTFTRVGNPSDFHIFIPPNPDFLSTLGSGAWVHDASGEIQPQCGVNFVPGVQPAEGQTATHLCCTDVCHAGATATHCIKHTVCAPCPHGACCNPANGSCTVVDELLCMGEYMGHGTSCADGDGDGIADILETGTCCAADRNVCRTGTDPTNPDTDGDGLLDGEELMKTKCDPCVPDAVDTDGDNIPDACGVVHYVKFSQPPKDFPCACNANVAPPFGGLVDALDVSRVRDCVLLGICNCTPTCDVNCDGVVDNNDVNAAVCRFQNQPPNVCCPPLPPGEDYPSNIDWGDMIPNQVVADDFISDGRPITAVRWWGSIRTKTPGNVEIDDFPNTSAVIEVISPLGTETVTVTGPTKVLVHLDQLADTDFDGKEEVPTEMVSMNLSGTSTLFGPISVRLRSPAKDPFMRTLGQIEENANNIPGVLEVPPFGAGTAHSFFDVFVEVEVGASTAGPGTLYHNRDPKHKQTDITNKPPTPTDPPYCGKPGLTIMYDEAGSSGAGIMLGTSCHFPHGESKLCNVPFGSCGNAPLGQCLCFPRPGGQLNCADMSSCQGQPCTTDAECHGGQKCFLEWLGQGVGCCASNCPQQSSVAAGESSDARARETLIVPGREVVEILTPGNIDADPAYGLSATPFDPAAANLSTGGVAGPAGVDVPLGGTNEPTIAVNPRNTQNVAVAAGGFQLRISMDGGATFQPAVASVVEPNHVQCGDSSLAFDDQGRLFWSYLGCVFNGPNILGIDVYVARCDPSTGAIMAGYPVNVTASAAVGKPAKGGFQHDKEWLAADSWPNSPFVDRLYLAWTEFVGGGTTVWASYSADQGLTWSVPVAMSGAGEGFVWPCHNAVAPNGDVYVAYHSQPGFAGGGYPNGVSGQIFILRSVNGGVAYPQKTLAYGPGLADMTFNVQSIGGAIPQTDFWLQGSVQPWILPDPHHIGRIYVVANDDPDNNPLAGDPANVYIAISNDNGLTWGAPARIDSGPGTTFQVMPTAAIDRDSACIAVHYYDNRAGVKNAGGNYLLDVFYTVSQDQGVTFLPDVQLNDVAFNPDLGAPIRFTGPPATRRIGEYNGIAFDEGAVHAVWCGNTATGQQTIYDQVPFACGQEAPDGWFISFHEHLQKNDPLAPPLALYFCDQKVVEIKPTELADCQSHKVLDYWVNLDQCCLVHANVDSRNGLIPAMKDAFHEVRDYDYDIDIQAVVGHKYYQDKETGQCIEVPTGNYADHDFWGWHTTQNNKYLKTALKTMVTMGPAMEWLYGPWVNIQPKCSFPNMAFELYTDRPSKEACGPGNHWIDTCPGGTDILTGTKVYVSIDTNLDPSCVAETAVAVTGDAQILRGAGSPHSMNTEMVSMTATGGGLTLTIGNGLGASPLAPSLGTIVEKADPALGHSTFNVFFEIDRGAGPNRYLYNHEPCVMETQLTKVPPKSTIYTRSPGCLPLYTSPTGGIHVANLGAAWHGVGTDIGPGACCDEVTDTCTNGVLTPADCAGEKQHYHPQTTCAELDPPCGTQYCGPGPHWIDTCQPGTDNLNTWLGAAIDTNLDPSCLADTAFNQFFGPAVVNRSAPVGHTFNQTIVSSTLTDGALTFRIGAGTGVGPLGGSLAGSLGQTVEKADPFVGFSYFNVFFELALSPSGPWVYNQVPALVHTQLTKAPPNDRPCLELIDNCIPLFTSPTPGQGIHVANLTDVFHCISQQDVPRGACCDGANGSCIDGVELGECLGAQQRWTPNTLCADLDPPCALPPNAVVWDPTLNPVPWPNTNPKATTRSLRFTVAGPPGPAKPEAIKITMVDLQHPKPANVPAQPPPNYTTYDTRINGVCNAGTLVGHHCDTDADCPGSAVVGRCSNLAACTAAGEANGCARWVGKPGTFLEAQDAGPGGGTYKAARLQCTPFYYDWKPEGLIAVVGAEIVPSSEYTGQVYGAACNGVEAGCTAVSAPVTMYTRRSGDVAPDFNPPATTTQPNALDVAAVVNKLKNLSGALVKAITQIQPNVTEPNADVSALDIAAVVDAVKSVRYPFSGPCACPSLVPCGVTACPATSCVTAYGAGAQCVKTCTGPGPLAGDPCINNSHCTGSGTCGSGFCRDRCGRCSP